MNWRKKIEGFTLLEAMVSLLLTTLLVALAFGVYINFSKSYSIFDKSTTRLTELLQFKNALSSDWFKSDHPMGNEAYLDLLDEQKNELITYEINDDWIVRKSWVNDTFQISVKEMEFSYLNKQEEIIEKISIEFEKNSQLYEVTLRKDHDLKTRMKYSVD